MNLRHARFQDFWRRLFNRTYPCRIKAVNTATLACIADANLAVPNGPLAIIGGNGVGKSTLALAIAELLDPENVVWGLHKRLTGSLSSAMCEREGNDFQLRVDVAADGSRTRRDDGFAGSSIWIDAAQLAHHCRRAIDDDADFQENLAGISGSVLSNDDLDIVQYVTGRRVTSCEIYEVSDYAGLERFPYFRISCGDLTYGSERMGFGELSLITLYWSLRSAEANSILILEEPETHISPRSQSAIMDYVARICVERSIQLIVTTHSPTVVQNFPPENVWQLIRPGDKTTILSPVSNATVSQLLGSGIRYSGALLVEDLAAKYFLLALLFLLARELRSQFEIVVAGSAGAIDTALNAMPRTGDWLRIIGIYDGDQRNQNRGNPKWPLVYLPSESAPEPLIVDVVNNPAMAAQLANALQRSETDVLTALDGAQGRDGHDWWHEIARSLDVAHEMLWQAFVSVWLGQGTNRNDAEAMIERLRAEAAC